MNNDEQTNTTTNFFKNLTFTFKIFTVVNLLFFISKIFNTDVNYYAICYWPISNKQQFYRIITHNFYHLNLFHITLNLIVFCLITAKLEKRIGSLFLMTFILHSIVIGSLLYLFQIKLLKLCVSSFFREYNFNFYCASGFSSVLFSLFYLKNSFANISNKHLSIFGLFHVKAAYSPYMFLVCIQIISPNSSLIGHLSGILGGVLIKNILIYITFPTKEWLMEFELKFRRVVSKLERVLNYTTIEVALEGEAVELNEMNRSILDKIFTKAIPLRTNPSEDISMNNVNNI